MDLNQQFQEAQKSIQTLATRPDNNVLLQLYALFKQGCIGDVQGSRPGLLDIKGRAKYDAWAQNKGMKSEQAKQQYVNLVARLTGTKFSE